MAFLPYRTFQETLSFRNKGQLLTLRDNYRRMLDGYRRQPPMVGGPDRDRLATKLDQVVAELATRKGEWPYRD